MVLLSASWLRTLASELSSDVFFSTTVSQGRLAGVLCVFCCEQNLKPHRRLLSTSLQFLRLCRQYVRRGYDLSS